MSGLLRMPLHLVPFLPYIEKEVFEPHDVAICTISPAETLALSTLENWLQISEELHGDSCCGTVRGNRADEDRPSYLIDVKQCCLVPGAAATRYVALSYVWGKSSSFCATEENLACLLERNSLKEEKLPRLVYDAMDLVRRLRIKFLWVDRLCILQDDGEAKRRQLNAMGMIYADCYFTLVAAQNNDASMGLYGKRRLDIPSSPAAHQGRVEPRTRPESHRSNVETILGQARQLMQTIYYSRGWTFQEYLFSRRRIVFHNDTVNWECRCTSWHEMQDLSRVEHHTLSRKAASRFHFAPWTGFDCTPWPDFLRYSRLVSVYNGRNLSFPEDVLDAFAGILSQLAHTFEGSFISGLPQMFFDAALLWQPWAPMKRRKAVARDSAKAVLPSWSWVGWMGDINSESWGSGYGYIRHHPEEYHGALKQWFRCSSMTRSTVTWYHSETLTGEKKQVDVSALKYYDMSKNITAPLPQGWTRHPIGPGEAFYRHKCDFGQDFWYPIPIRDQSTKPLPFMNSHYLQARTRTATFKLGKTYLTSASECTAIDLLDCSGNWAGVLRLNLFEDSIDALVAGLHSDFENRSDVQASYELIELSARSVKNQITEEQSFDEWDRPGCPRKDGVYEFYNVMWIEKIDGVAYRKAVGRVVKGIWEAAASPVAITLG